MKEVTEPTPLPRETQHWAGWRRWDSALRGQLAAFLRIRGRLCGASGRQSRVPSRSTGFRDDDGHLETVNPEALWMQTDDCWGWDTRMDGMGTSASAWRGCRTSRAHCHWRVGRTMDFRIPPCSGSDGSEHSHSLGAASARCPPAMHRHRPPAGVAATTHPLLLPPELLGTLSILAHSLTRSSSLSCNNSFVETACLRNRQLFCCN